MHRHPRQRAAAAGWRAAALLGVFAAGLLLAAPSRGRVSDAVIQITSGPSGTTADTNATFSWTINARGVASTKCVLDRLIETCTSPKSYSGIPVGPHQFTVRAYDSSGSEVGQDARSWTIVEQTTTTTPTTTTSPPPTTTAPPPPSGPTARLSVGSGSPLPTGSLAVLDASSSTGATHFRFDLDGNGSFETSCGAVAKAGVVVTTVGTHTVSALAVSDTGAVSRTSATLTTTGAPKPPSGAKPLTSGLVVGGCLSGGSASAALQAYACPSMALVGIAEAVFPDGAPSGSCFQRGIQGTSQTFTAPKGQAVLVDGVLVSPEAGAAVVLHSAPARVTTVGGKATLRIQRDPHVIVHSTSMPVDWSVTAPGVAATPDMSGVFMGLKVPDQHAALTLTAGAQSRLDLHLSLFWYVFDQLTSDSTVGLVTDDEEDVPVTGSFSISFASVPLGAISLDGVHLDYSRQGSSDVWSGGLSLVLPPGLGIGGQIMVKDGLVQGISATVDPPPPGLGPIACCIYATHFGVAYLSGSLKGDVTFTAGPTLAGYALASLDGSVTISPDTATGTASGTLKVVGIPLAQAAVVFAPTYLDFSGSIDKDFLGVFSVHAKVSADLNTNGHWWGVGGGDACLDIVGCVSAAVGASNSGIAACGGISTPFGDLSGGDVYYWGGGTHLFFGCSFGKLKSEVGALRRAPAAASPVTVTLEPGLSAALFRVTGTTGAPAVVLHGPGGRTVTTPGPTEPGLDRQAGWLVARTPSENATYIEVAGPAGGRWTIAPAAGSSPIRAVTEADGLPRRIATGSLSGTGRQRTLRYSVAAAPGVDVTFLERGTQVEHTLGTAAAGTKGTLRFSIADGPAGTRTIVARVDSQGLPVRTETIATFHGPGPVVLAAPRVRASRTAGSLLVRWTRVGGAARYRVRVALGDGRTTVAVVPGKRSSLRVPRVNGLLSAAAAVTALSASARPGRAGTARVAALESATAPRRASRRALLRSGAIRIRCVAAGAGTCTGTARAGRLLVARGDARGAYGRPVTIRVRLTRAGRAFLRSRTPRSLRIGVDVPGAGTRALVLRLTR